MTGTAFRFMVAAPILLLIGMAWGLQMGATMDHTLSPAHAHLNLVGGVLFAIFALYYHAVPAAAGTSLGKIHFPVALIGVGILTPGVAIVHSGGAPGLAIAGSVISMVSMLIFLVVIVQSKT